MKDQRPANLHKRLNMILQETMRQLNEVESNIKLLELDGVSPVETFTLVFDLRSAKVFVGGAARIAKSGATP